MEREILFTGIGGQGVQLIARCLASAALLDGREVQLFGSYGGMMRGGNTEATLVVSQDAIEAPPTGGEAWCAVLMHHAYAAATVRRLGAGAIAFTNSSAWEGAIVDVHTCPIPATDIAIDLGNPLAAGMVMLGALVAATKLVSLDSLRNASRNSVPAYRAQHVSMNERALAAGVAVMEGVLVDAWAEETARTE